MSIGIAGRLRNTRDNLMNVWIGRFVTINCYLGRPRIGWSLYIANGHITLDVFCVYWDYLIAWYWNPPNNVLDENLMMLAGDLPEQMDVPSVFLESQDIDPGSPFDNSSSSVSNMPLAGDSDKINYRTSCACDGNPCHCVGDVRPDDLESYPSGTPTVLDSEDKYR